MPVPGMSPAVTQSVVVVVISMTLIFAVAAFAIDVGQWFAKHHQAQVSADAAALAAANCLALQQCSSTTAAPGDDAYDKAVLYSNDNGVPPAVVVPPATEEVK